MELDLTAEIIALRVCLMMCLSEICLNSPQPRAILDAMQDSSLAALGVAKLHDADDPVDVRQRVAAKIDEIFAGVKVPD